MACVFNELKAFHAVGSKANDIFQGLFEEGLSMDVMSTIRAMIAANLFSIEEINKKICTYPYGSSEKRDRPRQLKENGRKDEKLPGRAIAVLNMIRIQPFLIQDFISDHENCLLKFILKAGIMLEIILHPTFTEGDILALQDVITDYFILRSLCSVEYPGFFLDSETNTPLYYSHTRTYKKIWSSTVDMDC